MPSRSHDIVTLISATWLMLNAKQTVTVPTKERENTAPWATENLVLVSLWHHFQDGTPVWGRGSIEGPGVWISCKSFRRAHEGSRMECNQSNRCQRKGETNCRRNIHFVWLCAWFNPFMFRQITISLIVCMCSWLLSCGQLTKGMLMAMMRAIQIMGMTVWALRPKSPMNLPLLNSQGKDGLVRQ